jgi:spermidine/putrescine transport system substrate-binding protein
MKRWVQGMIAVAAVAVAGGCRKDAASVLHVYTWADYIKPEIVQRFEQEHACKVVIDTFDSNESMYAKIKAGASGYDVIFPSSYMVKLMYDQGMLQILDKTRLPNLENLDADYLKIALDPAFDHSVPYMLTYAGIAHLQSKVKDFEPTWAMFDRTDLAGRATMLNDMRETIGAALKFLGHSLNTTDVQQLEAARDVVIRWKKNLAKFENEQYKTGIASNEFILVHGYSGDLFQVAEENKDIAFALPKEGFSVSCDDMVIPKDAPNPALAHAFINFLHEPKVAAENTEFISYLCPNRASYALLPEAVRADPVLFPPAEVKAKGEVISDLGEGNKLYTRIWDEIKAAK